MYFLTPGWWGRMGGHDHERRTNAVHQTNKTRGMDRGERLPNLMEGE